MIRNTRVVADAIMNEADLRTKPDVMSKSDTVLVLELMIDECKSRIEALKDEMKDDVEG